MGKYLVTNKIVTLGLMVALNVVLVRFASVRISIGGVEGIRIGLGNFPVVLSGFVFGSIAGGMVGAIGDILGFFLNPMGVYMPHFTLCAALTGIISGFVLSCLGRERVTFAKLLVASGVSLFVTSIILVPIFLKSLFGIPLWTTVPPRVVSFCLTVPFYALVSEKIGKRVNISFGDMSLYGKPN